MDGVRRPRYYNERDRRLAHDEEERLLRAAREEDYRQSTDRRLEQLLANARREAGDATPSTSASRSSRKPASATGTKPSKTTSMSRYWKPSSTSSS
jgi:hypothetical protein